MYLDSTLVDLKYRFRDVLAEVVGAFTSDEIPLLVFEVGAPLACGGDTADSGKHR